MPLDDPTVDHNVVIIGDGPTGLSAALLLAKNGIPVDVLGKGKTDLNKAHLQNYLGLEEEPGTKVVERARRQVIRWGARLHDSLATSVESDTRGYRVTTRDGDVYHCRYLVLATGRDNKLAEQLALHQETGVVKADLDGRTSRHNVYAGGWLIRGDRIQAAISVGDGAAIALDILSKEKGRDFHDFDTKPRQAPMSPTGRSR